MPRVGWINCAQNNAFENFIVRIEYNNRFQEFQLAIPTKKVVISKSQRYTNIVIFRLNFTRIWLQNIYLKNCIYKLF